MQINECFTSLQMEKKEKIMCVVQVGKLNAFVACQWKDELKLPNLNLPVLINLITEV